MMSATIWPWIALLLLGALHGVNPGMGWLFAVALGVQKGERRAVWAALLPLTAGHALAIAVAVLLAGLLGTMLPPQLLRWLVIASLALLGLRQLVRHRHPRWGGMRVTSRQLVTWSFLMASAHGAGLMAVPFAAETSAGTRPAVAHAQHMQAVDAPAQSADTRHRHHDHIGAQRIGAGVLAATLVHTVGYVLITGVLAVLVYQFAGLRLLRRAWVNVDAVWAVVLLATAGALSLM